MFQQRFNLNRKYMMSLSNENLLQNHYLEAGLWSTQQKPVDCHWGWESPTSQVRGHFLGHWLSAASLIWAETGDSEIKAKADRIISELARCQRENGGEWVGSIPTTYLDWIVRGKPVWAPQYTLHKTLMGLFDMYALTGNTQALDVLINSARWFSRWTEKFTRTQMDDILDVETGGMLEVWANLYNGILAQQHPTTGMIAYFLPLQPGAFKKWGTPTDDFWCCHGTLVQAQTLYTRSVYYQTPAGLAVCQYIPTEVHWDWQGTGVTVTQKQAAQTDSIHRTIRIVLPKALSIAPLPDDPDRVAFMDGPVVLAGITEEERMLYGDKGNPASILKPDNEREWTNWIPTYRTHGQPRGLRFIPLYEVRDERYTVYFPVSQRQV